MKSERVTAVTIALLLLLVLVPITTGSAVASVGSSRDGSPLTKFHLHFTLTSPNAQDIGWFGISVAVSGKTAVIGAANESVGGYPGAGHAYIYGASTGKLTQTLTSPNAQIGGLFGRSVAVSGSLVVIGAPYETANSYSEAGHAYVYDASTGSLTQTLTSPNAQTDGYFGWSVAVSGNLAVVGAYGETSDGYSEAGNAYVYNAMTGELIWTLTSPNAQYGGWFGESVAISGNLVVIGAPFEYAGGYESAGHVYAYNATTGELVQTFTSPNAQTGGGFGYSVAASGGLAVIGAEFETADGYSGAGHAYVYDASTGTLMQTLTSPNVQTDGVFGDSVAISGKVAVIGAYGESVGTEREAGHAYVYNAVTGKLVQTLESYYPQTVGEFGWSVAVNGKLAVIGAPFEYANGYLNAGHAYIYD